MFHHCKLINLASVEFIQPKEQLKWYRIFIMELILALPMKLFQDRLRVGTFLEHLNCWWIRRTLEIISAKNQTLTHKNNIVRYKIWAESRTRSLSL